MVRRDGHKGRLFHPAEITGHLAPARAPRMEYAARGEVDERGRVTRDGVESIHAVGSEAGDGGEQPVRVGVLGPVVDLADGGVLHHAPAVHHAHVIGHVGDYAQVVRDDDERGTSLALELGHEFGDLRLNRDIERRGRLVGDEQAGRVDEGHRDHDALAHASRELVGVVVDALVRGGDAHAMERIDGTPPRLRLAHLVVDAHSLGELIADAIEGMQARQRVLEDHRHRGTTHLAHLIVVECEQVGAIEDDATRDVGEVAVEQPHDRLRRHALARARLAHDRQGAALGDREGRSGDRLHDTVLGGEGDGEVVDLEEGGGHASLTRGSMTA